MDLGWLQDAPVRRLTRSEFQALADSGVLAEDERVELIRGVLVRLGSVSAEHEWAVSELFERLRDGIGTRARLRMNSAFALADDSQPQPDILVVPPRNYRHRLPSSAFLMIEVALSSLRYDRNVKARLYAEEGVPEYWLIDLESLVAHVFDRPSRGRYRRHRTVRGDGILTPGAFPDVAIRLADVLP